MDLRIAHYLSNPKVGNSEKCKLKEETSEVMLKTWMLLLIPWVEGSREEEE